MKNLKLNSTESAIVEIVELVSGIDRKIISGKDRKRPKALARSVLGYFLRDNGCTSQRTAEIVGRHHATILKYVTDHEWNMKYYEEYREFYQSVLDEYNTGYRKAKVQAMARQIRELQTSIESIKVDLL
jgi:chromosomal replication initiation ATPase DnaA|tara:strand:+ start:873 stop:1259 length:387 start_codon:yes stop_codon:yes gene_type:complete